MSEIPTHLDTIIKKDNKMKKYNLEENYNILKEKNAGIYLPVIINNKFIIKSNKTLLTLDYKDVLSFSIELDFDQMVVVTTDNRIYEYSIWIKKEETEDIEKYIANIIDQLVQLQVQ